MPTPDTETLAARLRAVERALTDEEAVLDPSELDRDTDITPAPPDPGPDASDPTSADFERRVRDLEAAVQALRGALDAVDAMDAGDERPATEADRAPTAVNGGEPPTGPDRPAGGDAWPDDLATGGK
jgi:hypothetical protein